jgi:uncharacterized cysteine cluster protein YcgN (CxxCxxCC family)
MSKPHNQKRETSWHILTCDDLKAMEAKDVMVKNSEEDEEDNDDYAWATMDIKLPQEV